MELKDIKGVWIDKYGKTITVISVDKDNSHPKDADYIVTYREGESNGYARAWAFGVTTKNDPFIMYWPSKEDNVRRILDKIK